MTKKRSSEILADENREICWGKGQFGEIFRGVRNLFSEIGGKCETEGGNASLPQRGWTPLCHWVGLAVLVLLPKYRSKTDAAQEMGV